MRAKKERTGRERGRREKRRGERGGKDLLSTMETIPQRLPLPKLEGEGEEEREKSLSVTKSLCELAVAMGVDQRACMGSREETDLREASGWCRKACWWGVRRTLFKRSHRCSLEGWDVLLTWVFVGTVCQPVGLLSGRQCWVRTCMTAFKP